MTSLQVFDPALCCSTGVCGVEIDGALIGFAADVDWVRARGATIERFNLAQQPMAFASHTAVHAALASAGEAALPMFLRDGQVLLSGRYPSREELSRWLGLADVTQATQATQPTADSSVHLSERKAITLAIAPTSACCSPSPAATSTQPAGASRCC